MDITGTVVNELGKPISEANVLITQASVPFPDIAAISNASGSFKLSDLMAGDYTISAFFQNGVVHHSLVLTESTHIELVLGDAP